MEELKDVVKLNEEEIGFLKVRENIILNKKIELQLIQNEKDIWVSSILRKYKLDEKKIYIIKENGIIEEKIETEK